MTSTANINDPRVVRALAHPLRVRILTVLKERVASPSEMADALSAPLGTVAYHVRILHQLELIQLVGHTPRRGSVEHHYRATDRPRVSDEAWGQASPTVKEALLTTVLNEVGDYVGRSADSGGFDRADAHLTRTPLRLDGQGFQDLAVALKELVARADEIERESRGRLQDGHEDGMDTGLVLMHFEAAPVAREERGAHRRPAEEPVAAGH